MDSKLLSTGIPHSNLPDSYVRPESERPRLSEVRTCENVPLIDLGATNKLEIIQQIADACRDYGFFQVINHGVAGELTARMLEIAHDFFHLPLDVKLKFYSDDPTKTMRLSTSFNVKKETVHNWRDYLRLHCHPLDKYVQEWPSEPSAFKDVVSTYCKEVRQLGFRLLGLVSLSLGLEEDYMNNILGDQGQHMAVNYYPPCPQPDLTYGLPGHTDPNTITILLQGQDIAGLQVLKDGKWLAVNPHPNAFIVNVGDQIQAIQEHGRGKVLEIVAEIQDRHSAAIEIEKSLLELHQVFLDMAVMVKAQGEQLDDIHHHVMHAAHYVMDGHTELKTAKGHQRRSRRFMCLGMILLLIHILVVVIPIATSFHDS